MAPSTIAPRMIGASDLAVYPFALGTSLFGWRASTEDSTRILDAFIEHGGTLIDTADSYAAGWSETIIGDWMRARGNRDRVTLATKIGRNPDNPGLGSVSIVRAVEASLTRLQTDHIDLLYFHDEDPDVPIESSLATVQWLIETGKVRYLAASNFCPERLTEARILSAGGLPQFVAVQSHYNLVHRHEFEGDLSMTAAAQGLGVLPYFALASGFLTGSYRTKNSAARAPEAEGAAVYLGRRGSRVLAALLRVATELDVSSAAVALAWLLVKRNVVAPVAGTSDPDRLAEYMAAAGIRLNRSQMLELDRVCE